MRAAARLTPPAHVRDDPNPRESGYRRCPGDGIQGATPAAGGGPGSGVGLRPAARMAGAAARVAAADALATRPVMAARALGLGVLEAGARGRAAGGQLLRAGPCDPCHV